MPYKLFLSNKDHPSSRLTGVTIARIPFRDCFRSQGNSVVRSRIPNSSKTVSLFLIRYFPNTALVAELWISHWRQCISSHGSSSQLFWSRRLIFITRAKRNLYSNCKRPLYFLTRLISWMREYSTEKLASRSRVGEKKFCTFALQHPCFCSNRARVWWPQKRNKNTWVIN